MPEFSRHALEVLRQPLEDGLVRIARAQRTAVFPARFVLIGAMNPCPCGFLGDPRRDCRCSPGQVDRYAGRLSGPLRDRIDLTVDVAALPPEDLTSTGEGESERGDSCPRRERARVRRHRARGVRARRSTRGSRHAQLRRGVHARPGGRAAASSGVREARADGTRLRPHSRVSPDDCGSRRCGSRGVATTSPRRCSFEESGISGGQLPIGFAERACASCRCFL